MFDPVAFDEQEGGLDGKRRSCKPCSLSLCRAPGCVVVPVHGHLLPRPGLQSPVDEEEDAVESAPATTAAVAENLLAEDAAVLVGERDGPVAPVRRLARLDPHVELACNQS